MSMENRSPSSTVGGWRTIIAACSGCDLIGRSCVGERGHWGTAAVLAVHATGTQIPLRFAMGADPVKFGPCQIFNRPGATAPRALCGKCTLGQAIAFCTTFLEKHSAWLRCSIRIPQSGGDTIDVTQSGCNWVTAVCWAQGGALIPRFAVAVEKPGQKKSARFLIFPYGLFFQPTQTSQLVASQVTTNCGDLQLPAVCGGGWTAKLWKESTRRSLLLCPGRQHRPQS